jgi:hypothetical protein
MDAELSSDIPSASREIAGQSLTDEPSRAPDLPPGFAPIAIASSDPAAINPLRDALAALDRGDYATAKRLFETLGRKDAAEAIGNALAALDRKDYATAERLFEALAPPKVAAPVQGPMASDWRSASPGAPPLKAVPFADAADRRPSPRAGKTPKRSFKRILLATGLVIFLLACLYSPRLNWTFPPDASQAVAGLASTVDLVKARLVAITGLNGREEDRAAMRDLSAALTQATIRLDQIEHEHGARLDRLEEHVEQNTSVKPADVASTPAAPAAEFARVAARVDELEKKVADTAQPAPESADVATQLNEITRRLDRLEKRAAVSAPPASELANIVARLDRLEKVPAVPAANAAKPLPPPKPSALMARADPSALSETAAKPDYQKPLLRDYAVSGARDGVAMVDSRYGPQEVAPGDFIPGAGRVLRIEKRSGSWFVVTSRGVIASGPSPY